MPIHTKQQGFVLISVLIITTISTMLAISAIGENRLQERIAGNQVKEVNARSEAEKGIFASYQDIQAQQKLGKNITEIAETLTENSVLGKYTFERPPLLIGNTLLITTRGEYQGARAYLKAEIEVGVTSGGGEYKEAIVGCEGVVMGAGGVVDSFDSTKGTYEKQFKDKYGKEYAPSTASAPANPDEYINAMANISTTYDTANGAKGDITQTGKAPIYGNINATGNYFGNGSKVGGDIKTNGNVNFTTKEAIKAGSDFVVSGDIYAGGDLKANYNPVKKGAFVGGDAYNTVNIDGNVNHKGAIFGDYNETKSKLDSTIQSHNVQTEVCDKKGLAVESETYASFATNGDFKPKDWQTENTPFKFTPKKAEYFNSKYKENDANNPLMKQYDATEIKLLGESRFAHVYNNFHLNTRDITVSGDVYIVVKNDFTMDGGLSQITIEKGSSLTMVVAGIVKTISGTEVIEIPSSDVNAVATNKSPMTLISTNKTIGNDLAINMQGTNLNMTIDAPLGKVAMVAGGSFKGAIRAKSVEVTGSGSIHYDEKLGSGGTDPTGSSKTKFASIYYYYP